MKGNPLSPLLTRVLLLFSLTQALIIRPNARYNERQLELKKYIDSGSIKLGEGDYFDREGKRIKEKPKEMEELAPPTVLSDRDDQTAMLQLPNTFMTQDYRTQKPIYFVPEVIYPRIKKRVIVHHEMQMSSFMQNQMFNSLFYHQFLKSNPFYKEALKDNDYQKNLEKNPYFLEFIKTMEQNWKIAK